jgi:hypothetical protein
VDIGPQGRVERPEQSDSKTGGENLAEAHALSLLKDTWSKLPLSFEENQGQADSDIKFFTRAGDTTLFLKSNEALFRFRLPGGLEEDKHAYQTLRMKFSTGRDTSVSGRERQPGKINYFIGNRPAKWSTGITTYAVVEYKEIYRGVDLKFYGNQHQLEYDFIVAPNADPNKIRLDLDGVSKVISNDDGSLTLRTSVGDIRQGKPLIYQDIDGVRHILPGRYTVKGRHQIGFEVASYDKSKPLVIDPVIMFATYFGGAGIEEGSAVAIDINGNAYITGITDSAELSGVGGRNVFVAKFNAAGSAREYLSVFGGDGDDEGQSIAVDSSGSAYVTGQTDSRNFAVANSLQAQYGGGGHDAFIAKLNVAGSAFVYSTYLGGSGDDIATGIALDGVSSAYITGSTDSAEYSDIGGRNCFVAKLNSSGSDRSYLAIIGGSGEDNGYGIAVDASGSAYVTGSTDSSDFTTVAPVQPVFGGGTQDAFLAKLNASGASLEYSTYFGGSGADVGFGVAIDSGGNAYITGSTDSPEMTTLGRNVFVAKFNSTGSERTYLNTFGGDGEDTGYAISVDSTGNAYVTGSTESTNFTLTSPLQTSFGGGTQDAFLAKLNAAGSALVYSTYLGGSGGDIGYGIALGPVGQVYVTGITTSIDFPVLASLQANNGGGSDAFIVKITTGGGPDPTPTPTPTATPTPTPTPVPRAVPILLTEADTNRAVALDSVTFARDPFPIVTNNNFSQDHRTRVMFFATNFDLLPGENLSAVTAKATDSRGHTYPLTVEFVGKVQGFDWLSSVVVKLPDDTTISGDIFVNISLPGVNSNTVVVGIRSP